MDFQNGDNNPRSIKPQKASGETFRIWRTDFANLSVSGSGLLTGLVNDLKNDLPFSLSLVPALEQSTPTRSRTLQTVKRPPQ